MTGMNVVGDLFGSGKMFCRSKISTGDEESRGLPFALYRGENKLGTNREMVNLMATVKGDVHDIGKNIVSVVSL
jgi:5-methyltetrahydrofolate--homocysteine methyltransferase